MSWNALSAYALRLLFNRRQTTPEHTVTYTTLSAVTPADRQYHKENFCSCDLDPMILIYELDAS